MDLYDASAVQNEKQGTPRPSLRVFFACANSYLRVLKEVGGSEYLARCPKCGKRQRFVVGEGGTPQREFTLDCR